MFLIFVYIYSIILKVNVIPVQPTQNLNLRPEKTRPLNSKPPLLWPSFLYSLQPTAWGELGMVFGMKWGRLGQSTGRRGKEGGVGGGHTRDFFLNNTLVQRFSPQISDVIAIIAIHGTQLFLCLSFIPSLFVPSNLTRRRQAIAISPLLFLFHSEPVSISSFWTVSEVLICRPFFCPFQNNRFWQITPPYLLYLYRNVGIESFFVQRTPGKCLSLAVWWLEQCCSCFIQHIPLIIIFFAVFGMRFFLLFDRDIFPQDFKYHRVMIFFWFWVANSSFEIHVVCFPFANSFRLDIVFRIQFYYELFILLMQGTSISQLKI